MNKIKSIILDQTNWLEVTWVKVETVTLPQEVVEGVADMVLRTQEVETIIHCESFGDSDEYQELLRQRLVELNIETTQELESILEEQASKRHIPTEDELAEIAVNKELQRIQDLRYAKEQALNSIVVAVNDKTFDGNENARTNMMAAILSADLIGKTEETWKLADNTSAVITITELKEALALSIQEVGRIVMVTSKEEL